MSKTPNTVESQSQAAALLGVPIAHVRNAKMCGCRAFKASNRIHLPTLKKYLEKHPMPAAPAQSPLPPLTSDQIEQQGSLEGSLQATVRDELETARLLQRARETGDAGAIPDLTLAVGRARKNRLALETAITKLQVERGQLITLDDAKRSAFRIWPPIMNCIRRIPRKAASALGDLDAVRVERCLDEQVEAAVAECKKMLAWDDVEQKRLARRLLLAAVCDPDGGISQETLEEVEGLREFVLAELAKKELPTVTAGPGKAEITSEF